MALGKNIRIKDIARLAGVSAGTVDRVLHNRGRVSEEALQKITEVMKQIDYKPNLIARTLGSNKKNITSPPYCPTPLPMPTGIKPTSAYSRHNTNGVSTA